LDGEDFERAADLIELSIPAMRQTRQEATVRHWLDALPEELFRARPVLATALVGVRMASGEIEGVEALGGHRAPAGRRGGARATRSPPDSHGRRRP
jgi:hypothetical protein